MSVLFERFISKERNEPLDIEHEHERREEVIQYLYNKYDRERAALIFEQIKGFGEYGLLRPGHPQAAARHRQVGDLRVTGG